VRPGALLAAALAALAAGCGGPDAPEPLPPGTFAFGVFGDGPYYPHEKHRFTRVIDDVNRVDLQWLLHVGDLQWKPCSDEAFQRRFADLATIRHPVVYTPGDNEWTDCHTRQEGRYDPLDRLAAIRRIFFRDPTHSLGGRTISLRSQAADSTFGEFVENARWRHGGFVFATIHLVGSGNGREPFPGRTAAHDSAVERRTRAAVAWLDEAFAEARATGAKGVVLAWHGNIGVNPEEEPREPYAPFLRRLEAQVASFPGPVLLIHGDSHTQRVDHPLKDASGRVYPNFTRLETFGSPDIGWVRVVVDSAAGRVVKVEPRLMRGW
jgi:hypothetical protein